MKDYKDMGLIELVAVCSFATVALAHGAGELEPIWEDAMKEIARRDGKQWHKQMLEENWSPIGEEIRRLHDEAEPEPEVKVVGRDGIPPIMRPMVAAQMRAEADKLDPPTAASKTTASRSSIDHNIAYLHDVIRAMDGGLEAAVALAVLEEYISELSDGTVAQSDLAMVKGEAVECSAHCCDNPFRLHISGEGDAFLIEHGGMVGPVELPENVRFYRRSGNE